MRLRILIKIVALLGYETRQFDVSAAYIHGEIDGRLTVAPPAGDENGGSVWKLLKRLYGFKQAGRIRHNRLKADLGITRSSRFQIGTWKNGAWAVCTF